MEKVAILEQTSLPRIVLFLNKNKKAHRVLLKQGIHASQSAIYRALDILKENELIDETEPSGFMRRKEVWLTEKGKSIAGVLEKLEALL